MSPTLVSAPEQRRTGSGAKRVLFVGPLPHNPILGGMGLAAGRLLWGLAARGYPVSTLTPHAPGDPSLHPFAERHPAIAVNHYAIGHDIHLNRSAKTFEESSAAVADALPDLITTWRPDVLLVISPAYYAGVRAVARRYVLPWIVWTHAIVEASLAGIARYPEELVPRIRQHMADADAVVPVAAHYGELLKSWGISRVTTIPNGIDVACFTPRPADPELRKSLGIRDDDVVVAHTSNLQPLKRGVDLVDSAALALRENQHLVYVIIGDGLDRTRVEEACRERGIASQFRFVGWVDHERMPEYLNLADMVVMPSGSEVMPLAYLEAQAAGTVLISSDIPAAHELIDDGRSGLLFPLGNVQALAECTLRMASDATLRRNIGAHALAQATRCYDIESRIDSFAELIDDVAARRVASEEAPPLRPLDERVV